MVLIRGDYEVNETKLKNAVDAIEVELLTDEQLEKIRTSKRVYWTIWKRFRRYKNCS